MFSPSDIFAMAAKIEESGEAFYRAALNRVKEAPMRDLLLWLAEEEAKHREWFLKKKADLPKEPALKDTRVEEEQRLLQDMISGHVFSLEERNPADMKDIDDLLTAADEFERDTIIFFEMIAAFVEDPETLNHLRDIIEEERRHIRLIGEYRDGPPRPDVSP